MVGPQAKSAWTRCHSFKSKTRLLYTSLLHTRSTHTRFLRLSFLFIVIILSQLSLTVMVSMGVGYRFDERFLGWDLSEVYAQSPIEGSEQSKPSAKVKGEKRLAVEVASPGSSWRLLNDQQVSALSNIAIAGAIDEQRALGLVLVEPIKGLSLTDYATALLENSTLTELLIESVDETVYQGQNALRVVYSGDEANGRFRYLCYTFIAHGRGYQIVAGGPVSLATAQSLEAFSKAVTLREVESSLPTPRSQHTEGHGVDWILRSGTLSHLLSHLTVRSADGWRALGGESLARLNSEAFAGLQRPEDQLNILFFDRRCPHEQEEVCLSWSRQELMRDLDLREESGTFEFSYLGDSREFKKLRHNGGLYTYLHHGTVRDGRVLQTLAWTLAQGHGAEAVNEEGGHAQDENNALWETLPSGLSLVSLMDRQARLKLGVKLSTLEERGQRARAHESWMWGRYHHFESGVTWTQPSGIWRVSAGPSDHLHPQNSLYTIDAPRYGLRSQLRIISGRRLLVTDLHRDLWADLSAQLSEARGPCQETKSGRRQLAQVTSHWTRCVFTTDLKKSGGQPAEHMKWVYQLDSFKASGAAVHLLTWAPKKLFDGEAEPVREALERGLSVKPPAAVVFTPEGTFLDERYRYQVRFLPAGGSLRVRPALSLGSTSSLAEYHTSELSMVSFAVGEMSSQRLGELVDHLSKEVSEPQKRTTQSSQKNSETGSAPKRRRLWIQGYQAERLLWKESGAPHYKGALLVTVPPLVYGLVAVGTEEDVKRSLKAKSFRVIRD